MRRILAVLALTWGCGEGLGFYAFGSAFGCDPLAGPNLGQAQQARVDSIQARVDSLPPGRIRTRDEKWADIARQVPGGWGGFFLDDGTPTIYLVDPTRRNEAIVALYALGVGQPTYDIRQSRVKQGRWDFAQLYDWKRFIQLHISGIRGLVMIGINEGRNRLEYGVLDPAAGRDLAAQFESLALPCGLVNITVTGGIVW
jgi:hypothetical protein